MGRERLREDDGETTRAILGSEAGGVTEERGAGILHVGRLQARRVGTVPLAEGEPAHFVDDLVVLVDALLSAVQEVGEKDLCWRA